MEGKVERGNFCPVRLSTKRICLKTVGPFTVNRVDYEGQIYLGLVGKDWKVSQINLTLPGLEGPIPQSAIKAISDWAEDFIPKWIKGL